MYTCDKRFYISVRVTAQQHERVSRIAKDAGVTISHAFREVVEEITPEIIAKRLSKNKNTVSGLTNADGVSANLAQ